jgi:predicted amidohydrolase
MLAYLYFLQKTDLLIGISNSPQRGIGRDGITSFQLWETMGYVYSQFYQQNYLFVNRVGFEDGIGFGGGSFFARAGQGIVQKAAYIDPDVLDAEVRAADVRRARNAANYLRDDQPALVLKEMRRILHA